jgi:hypothetical protein
MKGFTYEDYRAMLKALKETHKFFSYSKMLNYWQNLGDKEDPVRKFIVLRHDIDIDPTYALELSHIEYEEDISSTYFFLPTSPSYNIFSRHTLHIIRILRSRGHRIGLHVDYCQKLDYDCILSTFINRAGPVDAISPHNTAMVELRKWVPIPSHGIVDAGVMPFGDTDILYIADSYGHWVKGSPLEHREGSDLMEVNCHPFWWSGFGHISQLEMLKAWASTGGKQRTEAVVTESLGLRRDHV